MMINLLTAKIKVILKFMLSKFRLKLSKISSNEGEEYGYLKLKNAKLDSNEYKEVKKILKEYTSLYGNENGQFKSYLDASTYLDKKRMISQWELIFFLNESGVEFSNKMIADIGAGTGYLLRCISKVSCPSIITGFDYSPKTTILGPMLCPKANFLKAGFEELSEKFDIIFLCQVLEHLIDPINMLKTLKNRLKNEGILVITIPNGRVDSLGPGELIDNGEAFTGHINFWSPESFAHLLTTVFPNAKIRFGMQSHYVLIGIVKI